MNFIVFGLIIEVAALGAGWFIYQGGFGTGPEGVIPMFGGIAVAGLGLLIGGILGLKSLTKEEGRPVVAAITVILPLGILAVVVVRRILSF